VSGFCLLTGHHCSPDIVRSRTCALIGTRQKLASHKQPENEPSSRYRQVGAIRVCWSTHAVGVNLLRPSEVSLPYQLPLACQAVDILKWPPPLHWWMTTISTSTLVNDYHLHLYTGEWLPPPPLHWWMTTTSTSTLVNDYHLHLYTGKWLPSTVSIVPKGVQL